MEEKVTKNGWLKKQGGLVKNWTQRWFVLKGMKLYYYVKEDENRQQGVIELEGARIQELAFNRDEPEKWLFEIQQSKTIRTNHETYVIWATEEAQRNDWVSTIRRVIFSKVGGGVFGGDLETVVKYDNNKFGYNIPHVVYNCIEIIRKNGCEVEGIFRLSGRLAQIRELRRTYDEGARPDLDGLNLDVHSIAGLLKLYLRELPEPVIPYDEFETFLNLATSFRFESNHHDTLQSLRTLIWKLPTVNFNLLKTLSEFLYEISQYQHVNKMTEQNISVIFGTNILRSSDNSPEFQMITQNLTAQVVLALVKWNKHIFSEEILSETESLTSPIAEETAFNEPEPLIDITGDSTSGDDFSRTSELSIRATLLEDLSSIDFHQPQPQISESTSSKTEKKQRVPPAIPARTSESTNHTTPNTEQTPVPSAPTVVTPQSSDTKQINEDTPPNYKPKPQPRKRTLQLSQSNPTSGSQADREHMSQAECEHISQADHEHMSQADPEHMSQVDREHVSQADSASRAPVERRRQSRRSQRPTAFVSPTEKQDISTQSVTTSTTSLISDSAYIDPDLLPNDIASLKALVAELQVRCQILETDVKKAHGDRAKQELLFKDKINELAMTVYSERQAKEDALSKNVSLTEELISFKTKFL